MLGTETRIFLLLDDHAYFGKGAGAGHQAETLDFYNHDSFVKERKFWPEMSCCS